MKTDFVDRGSVFIIQKTCTWIDEQHKKGDSLWRHYLIIGVAGLAYPVKMIAELVENIVMVIMNALGSIFSVECRYDAYVYLRKATISLVKTALSPVVAVRSAYFAMKNLHYNKSNDYFDGVSDPIMTSVYKNTRTHYSIVIEFISKFISKVICQPPIDNKRVIAAIEREFKFYAILLKTSPVCPITFISVVDHYVSPTPIAIEDEWGRYWKVLNYDNKQENNIRIRELDKPYESFKSTYYHPLEKDSSDRIKEILTF